jgi:hypothetical protein
VDLHHVDADPDSAYHTDADPDSNFILCGSRFFFDADPDPTLHPDADPDPSFQIKAQTLEKVLKWSHIPYILACHLQIDADPVPDPALHFYVDPVADPDPQHWLEFQLRTTMESKIDFP